jgi:hypothetical protein
MAGKKGRSGPPGNMNNARHRWRAFWKRRALRPEDRWIASEVARYEAALLSDKPDASEAERRVIQLATEAKCARLLIWQTIRDADQGIIRKCKEGLALIPAAEVLPKFIGVELGALKLLGLQRRAKPIPRLAELLEAEPTDSKEPHDA